MLIQLYLYYLGYAWEDIHYSISAASSFIAAIIILLLHKWMPEFILSIIYMGTLITEPMKVKRKETALYQAKNDKKVGFILLRRATGRVKKNFYETFTRDAKEYGFQTDKDYLLIPDAQFDAFKEALEQKFKKLEESKK